MRAGPSDGCDIGDLSERQRAAACPCASVTSIGSEARSSARPRASGARRTVTSRVLPVGIDPVAGVDAGERRPQRLRDVADAHAERAGKRAIDLHVEFRLLPARRQADVHRARHLPDRRQHLVGEPVQRRDVGAAQLNLNLLLIVEAARLDCGGDAADLAEAPPQRPRDRLLILRALALSESGRTYTCPSSTAPVAPPIVV